MSTQADIVTDSEAHIAAAVESLGATEYEGGMSYAYTPAEMPGHVYLVSREDMATLGAALADGREDAYSLWCAETTSENCTMSDVLESAGITSGSDLAGERDAAARAHDIVTVAAIDLLDH